MNSTETKSQVISKPTYYRIILEATSAISIGTATSTETDSDVTLDSRGLPIIPATSLRGVCRSLYDDTKAEEIFGSLKDDRPSKVRFYDATHKQGNQAVSIRDNVKLKNDEKIAEDGLKFDRQITEAGAQFTTYIEVPEDEDGLSNEVEKMIASLHGGKIRVGAKTTRGMGALTVIECKKRIFDFNVDEDKKAWLDNSMFDKDAWWKNDAQDITPSIQDATVDQADVVINLHLKVNGAISIREYSTAVNEPDYNQLSIRYDYGSDIENAQTNYSDANGPKKGKPVIPGTSWAGAFRSRYRQFAKAAGFTDKNKDGYYFTEQLFGTVCKDQSGNQIIRKSFIDFSESMIDGGTWKTVTRNSIDRFTGGTVNGALFTEKTHYNGTTGLNIRVNGDTPELKEHLRLLLYAIADLHYGFLAVGGLTAVGHGLFEVASDSVIKYNGKQEDMFTALSNPETVGTELTRLLDSLMPASNDRTAQNGGE